ncbi:MAG: sigma-70 family RNA polymerase sigma factor [Bacteroidetes bacterium]|nr:sigma-70 family RNA polymerase sigma factor [Bacteroidota bacterium]
MVKKALNGDQKAYAELLHRYRESVYFTMLKMCCNKDDAEDLTIEAFGRAFKKLEQYSPEFAFSTWLFKIAGNNAIDFLRKKRLKNDLSIDRKIQENESEEHSNNIRSNTLDPEETFIKKQKTEHLHIIINSLKPKYKRIIEMFYLEELSHEEISVKLNMSVGTIKAQLFRARELLYSSLVQKKNKL